MKSGKVIGHGLLVAAVVVAAMLAPAWSRDLLVTCPIQTPTFCSQLTLVTDLTNQCPGPTNAAGCSGSDFSQKCEGISSSAGATYCFTEPVTAFSLFIKDGNCGASGGGSSCPFTPNCGGSLTVDPCSGGGRGTQYGCVVYFEYINGQWQAYPEDNQPCSISGGAGWTGTSFSCMNIQYATDSSGNVNNKCVVVESGTCKGSDSISHVAIGQGGGPCCNCCDQCPVAG